MTVNDLNKPLVRLAIEYRITCVFKYDSCVPRTKTLKMYAFIFSG